MEIRHGWYSAKAAKQNDVYHYRTPSGDIVRTTVVTRSSDKPTNGWDDLTYVGEVTEFIDRIYSDHWSRLE